MEFHLPELGEGVYEAELVEWRVKPGDIVKRGQNLVEVMTDKATMEVPSPFAGSITGLNARPGQVVKVGQVVLTFNPSAAGPLDALRSDALAGDSPRPAEVPHSPTQEADRPRAELSPLLPEGDTPRAEAKTNSGSTTAASMLRVAASPSVRWMARKLGIDLTHVPGTGPGGRILIEDLATLVPGRGEGKPAAEVRPPKPDYGTPGTRIKLAGLRRKVAEHLVHAKRTIPHYSYIDECEITDLVRLREHLKEPFARKGVKLTYLPFFVKAVVAALKEVPMVNASLDETAGEIVLHDRWNIGVAVAVPAGLIVPVIHDADRKDLATIAIEIDRLSKEARSGKIKLDDLRGGTFTITSIGNIGGLISTPVINHPEVGILGLGRIVRRPVFDAGGNIRPADIIYLSLSCDHRVVDGAVGAAFANAIIQQLQNPGALLIG